MNRILSLHELKENMVVWCERGKELWVAEITAIKEDDLVLCGGGTEVHLNPNRYGEFYRIWSGKPAKWAIGNFWNIKTMKIAIHNLYGINDGSKAYYRKSGDGCFDFVNNRKYASDLTEQECEKVMAYADWYCNQYKASHMTVEE